MRGSLFPNHENLLDVSLIKSYGKFVLILCRFGPFLRLKTSKTKACDFKGRAVSYRGRHRTTIWFARFA